MMRIAVGTVDDDGKHVPTEQPEVECAYVERGLAITRNHKGEGWRITHTRSGAAIGSSHGAWARGTMVAPDAVFPESMHALEGLRDLLPLADWNLEATAIAGIEGLRDKVLIALLTVKAAHEGEPWIAYLSMAKEGLL